MGEAIRSPDLLIGTNEHERSNKHDDRVREASGLCKEPFLPQEVRVVKSRHRKQHESDPVRAWVGPRPESIVFDPALEETRKRRGTIAGTREAVLENSTAYVGCEGHPLPEATIVKFTVETPDYYQTYAYGPGPSEGWASAHGRNLILFPMPWLVMDRIPKGESPAATVFKQVLHGELGPEQTSGVKWTEIDGDNPFS
jgi:hypothetical protein